MSQERDGRGATPYVTCQFAFRLSQLSLMQSMGSLGIRTFTVRLLASGIAWTADLIRACVLPPTACTSSNAIPDPRSIDGMLSLRSSRIRKGMTTTRHSRTRKVVRWAIARSAWMQLIVRPKTYRANRVGETCARGHHTASHHVLIYLSVFSILSLTYD